MFSVCSRKKYDKAISACNGALKISPDFQLAKNNLAWVEYGKSVD
jgi:hypothetical protein